MYRPSFPGSPNNANFHLFLPFRFIMLTEFIQSLSSLALIAAQQYDPQPYEPDDLGQAKNSDHRVG